MLKRFLFRRKEKQEFFQIVMYEKTIKINSLNIKI